MGRDTAPHLPVGISTQFVKCVRCGVRTLREPQPLSDVCCPGHGPPSCPVPVTAAMQGIVARLANLLRSTLPWSSQRPTLPLRGSLHDGFGERCGYSVALGWPTCASVIHTVLVLVVDAVPDPPARGDLVLPLLHLGSVPRSSTERASQRMLAVVSPTRVVGGPLPGCPRVRRGRSADLFPSLDRAAVRVAQVPTVSRRRWGNSFSPFRHRPQPGGGWDGVPARLQRLAEPMATGMGRGWRCPGGSSGSTCSQGRQGRVQTMGSC